MDSAAFKGKLDCVAQLHGTGRRVFHPLWGSLLVPDAVLNTPNRLHLQPDLDCGRFRVAQRMLQNDLFRAKWKCILNLEVVEFPCFMAKKWIHCPLLHGKSIFPLVPLVDPFCRSFDNRSRDVAGILWTQASWTNRSRSDQVSCRP